jgi:low temperature requirement protein LtrA
MTPTPTVQVINVQSISSGGAEGAGPLRSEPGAVRRFRGWFWRPPRAHGQIEAERRVSFLELFYDLVYVVVIAQAARSLAGGVTLRGYLEFLVVFGVVWIAWVNGTLYYELHGREDGRTRTFVFVQMALLALLAVFTAGAAGDAGTAFAVVYIAFLAVMTWLWYTVRRQDAPEYMAGTARYLAVMVVSIAVFALSALLPADARIVVWGLFSVGWIVFTLAFGWASRRALVNGIVPTDSMVERFDLLVIIVLGEVVTGVVNGLSAADKDVATLATGFGALLVGFGLWWIFFDVGGRRLPRLDGLAVNAWMGAHLPIAAAIVGAGAAMVGLIQHAHDPQAPAATSWLLGGSVALLLVALGLMTRTLADYERHAVIYRPLAFVMGAAAGVALLVGWWRPVAWLLALLLAAILAAVWLFAVVRLFRTGTWGRSEAAESGEATEEVGQPGV